MSYPLGQPVTLTASWVDANGNPANAGTMTLSVVFPDGTTDSTPGTQAATTTGSYSYLYSPTQIGRHVALWSGTGANAGAIAEPFDVIDLTASAGIVSLAEAKATLNVTSSSNDGEITALLRAITPVVEGLCGPVLRATVASEQHNGGVERIMLRKAPVISVTSVVEWVGTTPYTLTAQPLASGQSMDAYGYSIDLPSGSLVRRASGMNVRFARGDRNVIVTYVAGRTAVPENIKQGTLALVRENWKPQRAQGPSTLGSAGEGEMYGLASGQMIRGYFVPNYVIEMFGDEVRLPGIA